jgi:hypothetical protein
MTGDFSILDEPVCGISYLKYLYNFCLSKEDLDKPASLIDYGDNRNLLELKKTKTYQYYTPSPNAERLLIYDMLTELYEHQGEKTPNDLLKRKQELTDDFQTRLWNQQLGWPNTIDQAGNRKTSYSIQCFDAIRTGIYTRKMEDAVVAHLNEDEFLSEWGVHSLSKKDSGYDLNDVDWGGPGIYTGDGPELVDDLLQAGYFKEGVDLLKRIMWWGTLPYYPQAMRANSRGYREDGRANVIAGVGVSMHTMFGLFRVQVSTKEISIHPIEHGFVNGLSMKSLKIRGKEIDVDVSQNGKSYTVTCNGKQSEVPSNKAFVIKLD